MRRFIAGAVCPRCRAVDRIVIEATDAAPDERRRRCVACDYSDTLVEARVPAPATRLATRPAGAVTAQPVRLVDPAAARADDSSENT